MRHGWAMLAVVALLGCRSAAPSAPLVHIGALQQGLDSFLAAHPLASNAPIRGDLVERTSGYSVHVVQVRGSEPPHRHMKHDLVVQLLRGSGVFTIDGTAVSMHAGDDVAIPRGTLHWWTPDPGTTAVTLGIFAPPLDAPDTVPATDVDSPRDRR
jgi:quercetin dioxygenase-like cupin family protein